MTPKTIDALIEAARTAGRCEIMPRFRQLDPGTIETKTGPSDLVTMADQAAELSIAAAAQDILPGALIVGEEEVETKPELLDQIADAPSALIIDPIDGTWNYANGVPAFGTILAVTAHGETVFGLIYDPVNDDWIAAEKGSGAWSGRERSAIWRAPVPPRLSGFVPANYFPAPIGEKLWKTCPAFDLVFDVGCSAYEYRLLAQHSVAFNLAASLKPWDHAAGVLITQELGGKSMLLSGKPYKPGMKEGVLLSAISPDLFDRVEQIVSPAFQT
ncbi:MAG: inositol monophosphatase [Pseudomonadota bacterium]